MANNQSVRRHLDAFTRGRIIGKLEEGRSVTSVAAEFGIAHSIVSRLWRQFQTTGTAIRGFSSGRPRGTTSAAERYIVLQARRNRRQIAKEITRHTTQATGRPISRFTAYKMYNGRRIDCTPVFSLNLEHHAGDSTIWLISTPILRENALEVVRYLPSLSTPSTNLNRGFAFRWSFRVPPATKALYIYKYPCLLRDSNPGSTA
ncbi:transposable element Tc1 transposase [Trichonephila clavipes]|nr:transposable element Tc1 transposase [Trichonephila clavipes]